jgi:hypothetical protein
MSVKNAPVENNASFVSLREFMIVPCYKSCRARLEACAKLYKRKRFDTGE